MASKHRNLLLVCLSAVGMAACSAGPDRSRGADTQEPTAVSLQPLAPEIQEASSIAATGDAPIADAAAAGATTSGAASGTVGQLDLPMDPCALLDTARLEAALGVADMRGSAFGTDYGCYYTRALPDQDLPAQLTLLAYQGDEARRRLLDPYAVLLSSPGCRMSGSAHFGDSAPTATPFPAEVEGMMAQPLPDIFATYYTLLANRCVEPDLGKAAAGGSGSDSGLGAFGFRSLRQLPEPGDAAAYGTAVMFSTIVAHNLFVVHGDSYLILQFMGVPAFDSDPDGALAAASALVRSILAGERDETLAADHPPLTKSKLEGVTKGMSYEEVVTLLGYEGKSESTRTLARWAWQSGTATTELEFEDGSFSGTSGMSNVDDPTWKDKVEGLEKGMSGAEVEALLGPATSRQEQRSETFRWDDGAGKWLMLGFTDGMTDGTRISSGLRAVP